MKHLNECEHAFIKNGVVEHIFTFDESAHGTPLLDQIKEEQGCDTVVCLCNYGKRIMRWSTWDGTVFTPPTQDYLYSIGIANETQAELDAKKAELEKTYLVNDPNSVV